uniref:Uncharacterized protein n=1 Tax=Arundo donax TaxID=35708 RepID=A0A0A9GFE3_ARUDO
MLRLPANFRSRTLVLAPQQQWRLPPAASDAETT